MVGHARGAVPRDAVGSRCHCWTFLAPRTTRWQSFSLARHPLPSLAPCSPFGVWSPQSQDALAGAGTPLALDTAFSGWLLQSCLQQLFPAALGRPWHTLLLRSVCSRSRNCCECTRTLQRVTLPGDTVENPSSKRLLVCWRLRQRRSISSCWHSPAFVHHIWPRWKLSRARVSFPTCPSTMAPWQPRHCQGSRAGHGAAPGSGAPRRDPVVGGGARWDGDAGGHTRVPTPALPWQLGQR